MRRKIAILTLVVLAVGASAHAGWGRRYRRDGVVYRNVAPQQTRYVAPYQVLRRNSYVPQQPRYARPVVVPSANTRGWTAPVPVQSPFPPPMMGG